MVDARRVSVSDKVRGRPFWEERVRYSFWAEVTAVGVAVAGVRYWGILGVVGWGICGVVGFRFVFTADRLPGV